MADGDTDHAVTVYTRDDCPLCEDAKATVSDVVERVDAAVAVDVVNVDADDDLRAEYGERVPYVLVDGVPKFKYRVDASELEALLA